MNQQSNNDLEKSNSGARQRLLDAAEQLFAEQGFEGASSREITALAGCNVAAINYHFGGKEKLYRDVFRRRMLVLRDIRIKSINGIMTRRRQPTLEELLTAFARAFVEPLVAESAGRCHMKLMIREMLDHRLPAGMFFEETISPVLSAMLDAVMKLCPAIGRVKAAQSIQSVVAQLLHTVYGPQMLAHTASTEPLVFDLDRAIEHIVEFSAAGIRVYTEGGKC